MDIRTIRHLNLLRLVREAGGQKPLAERTGVSAAYVCQVLSRKVNRNVGHSLARRLEAGMRKPYGWMDVLPGGGVAADGPLRESDLAAPYGGRRPLATRRAALLALAREAGGLAAVAGRCHVHPPYLEAVAAGRAASSSGPADGVPDDLARGLEAGMGKPTGWLDRPPEA